VSNDQAGSPPAAQPGPAPAGRGPDSDQLRELMEAGQEMALAAVALNSAGATLTGMLPNDLFCLWRVTQTSESEPVTSGLLAELTGLTTGAITGVVDRLEAAGFVRRERDAHDRRKLLIQPVPERVAEIYGLYEPLQNTFRELGSRYDDQGQAIIADFLQSTAAVMRENVRDIRTLRKNTPRKNQDA
jgi:DNA-binding MarR family transcriptional regulator